MSLTGYQISAAFPALPKPATDFSNADSALLFQQLSHARRDEYDALGAKRGGDPELGGKNQVTSPHSFCSLPFVFNLFSAVCMWHYCPLPPAGGGMSLAYMCMQGPAGEPLAG